MRTEDTSSVYYYKLHSGRNRFCCYGHGVYSRDMAVFFVSLFLIVGVSALFFAFECRFLTPILTPIVPILGGIQFCYVLGTFLRTAFTDPGIIPRATKPEVQWIEHSIATGDVPVTGSNNSLLDRPNDIQPTYPPGARTRQVLIRDHMIKLNYCHSCRFFRPPRASHCSTCDNCVERFDHHCPWVGNCIGQRNYRYFILFLYSLSLYCLYVLVFAIVNLVLLYQEHKNVMTAIKLSPASLIEIAVAFLTMWTIIGLAGYHTLLMCRGITTHEDIRHFPRVLQQAGHKNPFAKKNKCSTFIYALCGPQIPSLLRGWRKVGEDSWPIGTEDFDVVTIQASSLRCQTRTDPTFTYVPSQSVAEPQSFSNL